MKDALTPQLRIELEETQKDLTVFHQARDLIRRRVEDVRDEEVPRLMPNALTWSGTDAALGTLDLVVHALERTAAELKDEIEQREGSSHLRLVGKEDE
jgi:hypothetical protein